MMGNCIFGICNNNRNLQHIVQNTMQDTQNSTVVPRKKQKDSDIVVNYIQNIDIRDKTIQSHDIIIQIEECCICRNSENEAYKENIEGFCLLKLCKESDKHIICNICVLGLINSKCPLCRKKLNTNLCNDIRNSLNNIWV